MRGSATPTLRRLLRTALATAVLAAGGAQIAAAQTLVIESWRNDDADIWTTTIIPAFNATYLGVETTAG